MKSNTSHIVPRRGVADARGPGFLVRRLQQVSVSIFLECLKPMNITPLQNTILLVLEREDSLDQITVATRAMIDTSTVKDVLTRLEDKGLLTREYGVQDRRKRLIVLTNAGREVLARAASEARRASRHLLAPLSIEERKLFMQMIDRVVTAHEDLSMPGASAPWRRARLPQED